MSALARVHYRKKCTFAGAAIAKIWCCNRRHNHHHLYHALRSIDVIHTKHEKTYQSQQYQNYQAFKTYLIYQIYHVIIVYININARKACISKYTTFNTYHAWYSSRPSVVIVIVFVCKAFWASLGCVLYVWNA